MPSLVNAAGFPIPQEAEARVKRPEFVSKEMAAYMDEREEAIRRHGRAVANGVNQVGLGAFSPKTYVKSLSGTVSLTGTSSGAATQLTTLNMTIVSPIPATLWFDLTAWLAEVSGTASDVGLEVRIDGTAYVPRVQLLLPANGSTTLSSHGPFDAASTDGAFWLQPATACAVTVWGWRVDPAATVRALSDDTVLRVRVEPRLLEATP